jgi:hypothetical protein
VTKDHETIWLQAKCREYGINGREWCQDDVWGDDCGCGEGHKPTKYVRADLLTQRDQAARAEERERCAKVVEGYTLHGSQMDAAAAIRRHPQPAAASRPQREG